MVTRRRSRWSILPAVLAVFAVPAAAASAAGTTTAESAGARPLPLQVEVEFTPGAGSRTLVTGTVVLPAAEVTRNEHGFHNLALEGAVLVDGRRYDRFGYRFDVPVAEPGAGAPLTLRFERALRPGSFALDLRVEDLQSGRAGTVKRPLEVPRLGEAAPGAPAGRTGTAPALAPAGSLTALPLVGIALASIPAATGAAQAGGAAAPERPAIRLAAPPPVVVGKQRFAATVRSDAVAAVAFYLDGKRVLTRTSAPYTVELDLGERAELHRLRVEALDGAGAVVASDEVELNAGEGRFAVRLAVPPAASQQEGRVVARVEVEAPGGRPVDRVELFLDDRPVGVLHRPPFAQPVQLAGPEPTLLRAVAYLGDGSAADASLLLNAPHSDVVDVDLVELYTAVVDTRGRPVRGLDAKQFRVYEEGAPQRLERFEEVDDLPLHVALVVDTSTSMTMRLAEVKAAALEFLRQIVTPQDRVSLITFDNAPRVRVDFTSDLAFLANGLEGLRATGGTALYDSLVFALEELQGIEGQRVVVLLSDGLDERSGASAEDVLELARRAAVTLYTLGLEDRRPRAPALDRPLLQRLAEESGGRCFFVATEEELRSAYAAIEQEVRARYLLAYYSSHAGDADSFRLVDVEVARPRLAARTIRGYYP